MEPDNYFTNLNSITRKIVYDIEDIKQSYEYIWNTLLRQEKNDIINETLIKPEISLKYYDQFSSCDSISKDYLDLKNINSFKSLKCGSKIIQDDINPSYIIRDEHSAPFSYKTKSQMNLSVFSNEIEPQYDLKSSTHNIKVIKLKVNDSVEPKVDKSLVIPCQKITNQSEFTEVSKETSSFFSKLLKKPTTSSVKPLLDMQLNLAEEKEFLVDNQSSLSVHSESDEDKNFCDSITLLENKNIEKGYDFLANW